jgi:hypothetical protein
VRDLPRSARGSAGTMRRAALASILPGLRARDAEAEAAELSAVPREDAEELFYESVQLHIRAQKAHTKSKRDALHAKGCCE